MTYKIKNPDEEITGTRKDVFIEKNPYLLNKKQDKKKLFLEDLKNKDTITEQELLLIKRRLNDGTYTSHEVYEAIGEDGKALTPEQTEKGFVWLKNKGWGKTGKERENSPFRYREEEILNKFSGIRIKEFYDSGRGDFHNYIPLYEVEGNNTSFEYYVQGGEISIVG